MFFQDGADVIGADITQAAFTCDAEIRDPPRGERELMPGKLYPVTSMDEVERDIENFKVALAGAGVTEGFLPVAVAVERAGRHHPP